MYRTELIRVLNGEEMKDISSFEIEKARKIINRKGFKAVGDTVRTFEEEPIKNGLYLLFKEDKEMAFYVVKKVLDDATAVCYSIY